MKKELSLEVIERGLSDKDWDVRCAAMNACRGRDVPLEVIERWLKDEDWDVRCAAMNWYKTHEHPIPIIRTIEPSSTVYKKSVGNVIVCATIPKDAQVRGGYGKNAEQTKQLLQKSLENLPEKKSVFPFGIKKQLTLLEI